MEDEENKMCDSLFGADIPSSIFGTVVSISGTALFIALTTASGVVRTFTSRTKSKQWNPVGRSEYCWRRIERDTILHLITL